MCCNGPPALVSWFAHVSQECPVLKAVQNNILSFVNDSRLAWLRNRYYWLWSIWLDRSQANLAGFTSTSPSWLLAADTQASSVLNYAKCHTSQVHQ